MSVEEYHVQMMGGDFNVLRFEGVWVLKRGLCSKAPLSFFMAQVGECWLGH
jgi:hypothetical protein